MFVLRISPNAEEQIRREEQWWAENRTKAPTAFVDDLNATFDFIARFPEAGEPVRHRRIEGLRRVLIARIRCFVYYVPNAKENVIEILSLWPSSRAEKPNFGV